MRITKFQLKACCGGTSTMFKTDEPLTASFLDFLKIHGFREAPHLTKAGILYADNSELIISAPFGSNQLQIKCKSSGISVGSSKNCDQKINDFENLMEIEWQMGGETPNTPEKSNG